MTRLFVDEREIAAPLPVFSSLDDVIRHVEGSHLPPNSVIRQINIDGRPLVSDEFQKDPSSMLGDIDRRERIDILTGTVRDIAADSIREADSYLERVKSLTPMLAASFQACPGPEAFENLRQLYEGFYWINLLMDRLESTFHISLDNIMVEGICIREHHRRFLAILKQLVDSQEREDLVAIADLLEYEVRPFVPIWQKMLGNIRESLIAGIDSSKG
jgi:hypothetical protein